MNMYIDANTIIMAASLLGAVAVLLGGLFSAYKWYLKQNKQDEDIAKIKEEQCLLTYGILACLDGLEQLGCNHKVTEAKGKFDKYINKKAHEQDE